MAAPHVLSNQALIGDLAQSMRGLLKRSFLALIVVNTVIYGYLALKGSPAATAFLLISASSIAVLVVWTSRGEGLPIVPLLALQNLFIYGLPIVIGGAVILQYPSPVLTTAGREVLICNLAMIIAWRVAMEVIPTYSPLCFALQGINDASPWMARLGITLLSVGTAYQVLQSAGWLSFILDLLPAGSASITSVLVSAVSASGFFLAGIMIGRGRLNAQGRTMFWIMLAVQCVISAAGFLLSGAATVIFASIIGLFWGNGKIPWRFIAVALFAMAFLNLGKFTMRDKYWHTQDDDSPPDVMLADMPRVYAEWITASTQALTGENTRQANQNAFEGMDQSSERSHDDTQTLFARIDTLQNLLYVVDVMETSHLHPLDGATYTLIPPLLVPRILWPNKPRSHEGQVLLNVYFGRQDKQSTLQTYIAWGLLPEAYGNFGPVTGAILLGSFLGAIFAWVEKYVARKLLLSMEGFLSFTIFLGMANSFEMVASVLVTSLFQACVPVVLASMPFVERLLPKHTANEPSDG